MAKAPLIDPRKPSIHQRFKFIAVGPGACWGMGANELEAIASAHQSYKKNIRPKDGKATIADYKLYDHRDFKQVKWQNKRLYGVRMNGSHELMRAIALIKINLSNDMITTHIHL